MASISGRFARISPEQASRRGTSPIATGRTFLTFGGFGCRLEVLEPPARRPCG
jgi:hypothetical protein